MLQRSFKLSNSLNSQKIFPIFRGISWKIVFHRLPKNRISPFRGRTLFSASQKTSFILLKLWFRSNWLPGSRLELRGTTPRALNFSHHIKKKHQYKIWNQVFSFHHTIKKKNVSAIDKDTSDDKFSPSHFYTVTGKQCLSSWL